jgi:hypothetical protein
LVADKSVAALEEASFRHESICYAAGDTFAFVAVILDCLNDAAKSFYHLHVGLLAGGNRRAARPRSRNARRIRGIDDNVLHNRYEHDSQERRMALAHLCAIAYGMHTGAGLGEQFDRPRPEVRLDDVGRILRDFKQHSHYSEAEVKDVESTCADLLSRSETWLGLPAAAN